MSVYELRQYKVRPGKMTEWLALMEGEIIPYIVSKGMVVNASFCSAVFTMGSSLSTLHSKPQETRLVVLEYTFTPAPKSAVYQSVPTKSQ